MHTDEVYTCEKEKIPLQIKLTPPLTALVSKTLSCSMLNKADNLYLDKDDKNKNSLFHSTKGVTKKFPCILKKARIYLQSDFSRLREGTRR